MYSDVDDVLIGSDNKIAVVRWVRGPNGTAGPAYVYVGTVDNFGPAIQGGVANYNSPTDIPELRNFYDGSKLAFTIGNFVYRWMGSGGDLLVHGPGSVLPSASMPPAGYIANSWGLSFMAADGRMLVGVGYRLNGFEAGSLTWLLGTDGVYTRVGGEVYSAQANTHEYYHPNDPGRPGNKLAVISYIFNSSGLYGGYATSVNPSTHVQVPAKILATRLMGGPPTVLRDPATFSGSAAFNWANDYLLYVPQMGSAGQFLTVGEITLPPPNNTPVRRALAWYENGNWQLLAKHGDVLPGMAEGETLGNAYTFYLENDGFMTLESGIEGPGTTTANNAGFWIGQKTVEGATFDLILRRGETVTFPGDITATLTTVYALPYQSYDYPQPGPDCGRRRTMMADGTMARHLNFTTPGGGYASALYLMGPAPIPSVTTLAPTAQTATSLTVAGTVNPQEAEVTVFVQYGATAALLDKTIAGTPGTLSGETDQGVSAVIPFLPPNKDCFYRVVVTHIGGTTVGNTVKAKTSAGTGTAPAAATLAVLPASITHAQAVLSGTAKPGSAATAEVRFEYGLSATALNQVITAAPATVTASTATPVSSSLGGLLPHTKYFYRAAAASATGLGAGSVMNFTTLDRKPAGLPDTALAVPGSPVTIHVLANDTDPDGDALTVKSFTSPPAVQGKVAKSPSGTAIIFTPAATFTGQASPSGATFTYIAQDAFGGVSDPVTVTVDKDTIGITPTTSPAGLLAAGLTYPVTVDTGGPGTPWSVVESSPFVSVSGLQGGGDGPVNLTVAANTTKTARTATVTIGGVVHTITQSGVVAPVLVSSPPVPLAIVGGTFNMTVPTSTPALPAPAYTAAPLPAGLKLVVDPATGVARITGVPTKGGSTSVTVKATNAAGPSSVTFTIVVRDLPDTFVGDHVALIGDNDYINSGNRAYLSFKTLATGALSGKLTFSATESYPFSGALVVTPVAAPAAVAPATAQIIIPRKSPLISLVLNLKLETAESAGGANRLTGSLYWQGYSGSTFANFLGGWRTSWSSSTPATTLKDTKGKNVSEYYTIEAAPPAGSTVSRPLGSSYVTATMQPSGLVNWTLVLADDVTVTGSGPASPTLQFIIHSSLYKKTAVSYLGGISGMPRILRPNNEIDPSQKLRWRKFSQTAPGVAPTYTYLSSFQFDASMTGGRYTPPTGIVLGLASAASNARLEFADGGIASATQAASVNQTFTISAAHKATFTAANNPTNVSVTLNPATGLFNGTFSLTDGGVKRTGIKFKGVLLPDGATPANSRGKGFFVLPQLPATGTSTATTSRLSGSVILKAP
ncbi:MAG: cadherin-like domain-containing protein [Verrucomicrobiota bacterium]